MTNYATLADEDARALRHWADFGLVYPRTPSFEPGSPTPGHEVAPPQYRPGASVTTILHVEATIAAAYQLARVDALAAEAKTLARAIRAARVASIPVDATTGRAEAARAGQRLRAVACGMRAILALAYSPIRGHAGLERTLATREAEELRSDAEDYYRRAVSAGEPLPRPVRRPPPVEQQRAQVTKSLAQTMRELRRLVRQLGMGAGADDTEETSTP